MKELLWMLEGKRAEEGMYVAYLLQTMRAAWLNTGSEVTLKDCHPHSDLVAWPKPREMTHDEFLRIKQETGL